MDNKFFIRHAPFILFINVLGLHLLGYLLNESVFRPMTLFVWLSVGTIDAVFAFFCGRLIQRLNKQAVTDSLTGIKNREFFYAFLTEELKKLERNQGHLSLLFLDLDNFKTINDEYGHLTGDKILIELSELMQLSVRARDIVVRWGGEEFAILLPQTEQKGAVHMAERLRSLIEAYNFSPAKVTVSIGVATTNQTMDVDSFVKLADSALYKAKKVKNIIVF